MNKGVFLQIIWASTWDSTLWFRKRNYWAKVNNKSGKLKSLNFNVVTAAKSIGKSCILNIEKGEGEIDRIQCNFIENEE